MALQIVWLVVITLVAVFCMTIAAPHLVRLLNKSENDPVVKQTILLRRILTPTLPILGILLTLLASLTTAILTLSIIAFTLGLFAYYFGRRFASRGERIPDRGAFLLRMALALATVSTALWFVAFVHWTLFIAAIPLWLLIGYLTTELAIRKQMNKSKEFGIETDREKAIMDMNHNQGRRTQYSSSSRYPFP